MDMHAFSYTQTHIHINIHIYAYINTLRIRKNIYAYLTHIQRKPTYLTMNRVEKFCLLNRVYSSLSN